MGFDSLSDSTISIFTHNSQLMILIWKAFSFMDGDDGKDDDEEDHRELHSP